MAAITDPEALAFVDQHIRPLSEMLRALEARIEDAEAAWFNGVNATLTGADTVENRSAEGLPALTGTECGNIITALMAARDTVTETAGRAALIEKACVRPIDITV